MGQDTILFEAEATAQLNSRRGGPNLIEPNEPTIARAVPLNLDLALKQLLAYERFSKRSKDRLRSTEHPNSLPASYWCPGQPSGRAGDAEEALARLRSTMDAVEDAMSGIPKQNPPPAPGMSDGRMYPPLDDFVSRNPDGGISATTKGHQINIGANGSTTIINKKTGTVEFEN